MTISAMASPIEPDATPCGCPGARHDPVWHAPISLMQAGLECCTCGKRWPYTPPERPTHDSSGYVRLGAFAPSLPPTDARKVRANQRANLDNPGQPA